MNCQVCFENYNDKENRPYTITPCGHSFCTKCLDSLTDKSCPKCRREINDKIINYAILDLLDLNLVPDINATLKKSINSCFNEIDELKDTYQAKLNTKLSENQNQIQIVKNAINKQANNITKMINNSKKELIMEADSIMNNSNSKLSDSFENDLTNKSIEYKAKISTLNQFEKIELNTLYEDLIQTKDELILKIDLLNKFNNSVKFEPNKQLNSNLIGSLISNVKKVSHRQL